jgi:SAM-dependent methyltransferase
MINNVKLRKFIIRIPFSVSIYYLLVSLANWPKYIHDLVAFKRMAAPQNRFPIKFIDLFPSLRDNTKTTPFDPHYTYHPAWAARVVAEFKPEFHVDISSSIHFSTIVSAFIPVKFFDYRPAELNLPGMTSERADLLSLPFGDNSVRSISCMHTIEHVGLGRYGDKLDPDGDIRAINELKRVLSPGGVLIFVVPISGRSRIEFNSHRYYSYSQIMEYFSDVRLKEFSLIPDNARTIGMIKNASKEQSDAQDHGCGCFVFTK